MILLARPSMKGTLSVEEALAARRSVRQYTAEPLTLEMVSRLLWAAQGQTATWGGRTAPSAGALFPIEVTVVVGEVSGLEAGVYGYRNDRHALERRLEGDTREALAAAALGQGCLRDAPVVLVLSAVYERTKKKYGERGVRYAQIEIGAVCENLYLQAESLGLGTVLVGAFYDDEISEVLDLGRAETPLVLMPIGYPSVAVSD
ncbi:MAG: SagB/ThcOx family dehydrogenase [Candidatus Eisenbacteria sp.]|nr:SagB/ThcOx family dehydrogenase [Candidatus Eisenbacteria bacterium]